MLAATISHKPFRESGFPPGASEWLAEGLPLRNWLHCMMTDVSLVCRTCSKHVIVSSRLGTDHDGYF